MKKVFLTIALVCFATAVFAAPPSTNSKWANSGSDAITPVGGKSVVIGGANALTAVPSAHDFANATARDAYFDGTPDAAVGDKCHLQDTGFIQECTVAGSPGTWVNLTALTKGPTGDTGAAGADGADGADGTDAEVTAANLATLVGALDAGTLATSSVCYVVIGGVSYKTTVDDVLGLIADGHIPAAITRDAEWNTQGEVETIWGVTLATDTELADKANIASPTFTGKVTTAAAASGSAGFNLPHGTAPSSPANGDCWTTTLGLYCRVNGATVGPYGVAGSGTDANAIHDNVAGEIAAITEKASPVSGDMIIVEDSADSNNKKMVQVGNLPGGGTDDQTIDTLSLGGTTLSISLEGDGEAPQTVDLAGLQDGTGTDDQTAAEVTSTATGNIVATDVDSAIAELEAEKLPIQTIGIADNNLLEVDDAAGLTADEIVIATANGVKSTSTLTGLNFAGFSTTAGTIPVTDENGYLQDSYAILAGPTAARTYTFPDADTTIAGIATSQTLTNKTIDAGSNTLTSIPWEYHLTITSPADADDVLLFKAPRAITVTDIFTIIDPGDTGESISVNIMECDGTGDNCATLDAAITADNDGAEDDGTLTNGAIDSGDWVQMVLGAPSGPVTALTITIVGTQSW